MLQNLTVPKNEKVKVLNADGEEEESQISSIDCEDNEADFFMMEDEERKTHMIGLWRRAYLKGRAGGRVIRFFNDLSRKIYLFGVSKNLEQIEKEEIPAYYILQPGSSIKSYWNIVNITLLLYTALYMPYRIAFIDDNNLTQVVLDWVVDVLFTIDIIVTFLSAYEEEDGYV